MLIVLVDRKDEIVMKTYLRFVCRSRLHSPLPTMQRHYSVPMNLLVQTLWTAAMKLPKHTQTLDLDRTLVGERNVDELFFSYIRINALAIRFSCKIKTANVWNIKNILDKRQLILKESPAKPLVLFNNQQICQKFKIANFIWRNV